MRHLAPLALIALLSACQQPSAPPDPRIAAIADRQAIDQLIAGDYPRALDAHDMPAYAATYTEDGEMSLAGQSVKGRDAIMAFVGGLPTEPRVIHVITNLSYDIAGDTATGGAYWQDIGHVNGAPSVVVAGHYDDTLRKVNGDWKIAKRAIVIDFAAAAAAPPPTE